MNPDNTSSKLWGEEAVVQGQTGTFLPNQRFHFVGPSLQKRQQLGKPSENPGEVGAARPCGWKKICKLEGVKGICFG